MCELTKKLFEIVDQIPDDYNVLTLEDRKESVDGATRYRLNDCYATTNSLLSHQHVSIALTSIPEGCVFPEHVHHSPVNHEILIILKGILKVKVEEEREYGEGDMIVINRNIKHSATAVEDATFVAITIPRDEGFPQ